MNKVLTFNKIFSLSVIYNLVRKCLYTLWRIITLKYHAQLILVSAHYGDVHNNTTIIMHLRFKFMK